MTKDLPTAGHCQDAEVAGHRTLALTQLPECGSVMKSSRRLDFLSLLMSTNKTAGNNRIATERLLKGLVVCNLELFLRKLDCLCSQWKWRGRNSSKT